MMMMMKRHVMIAGTGNYLPRHAITSHEMDRKIGKPQGWSLLHKQVATRYIAASDETSAYMGACAARSALKAANMAPEEVDCIISAAAVMQQPIPSTASLIKKELGLDDSPIPAFDINSTCLSFLTALDMLSYLIEAGRFKNVLIISSEKPTLAIDWNDLESCTLFSDGAAAVLIKQSNMPATGSILSSHMVTHSTGTDYCEIKAGGTAFPPGTCAAELALFRMKGKEAYRLSSQHFSPMLSTLLHHAELTLDQIDCIIPHQASPLAISHLIKRTGINKEKLINIFADYGNQVAASIPMALDYAVRQQRINRGDKLLLIGTAAGISLGGMVMEY